jgi:hypothetical protein
MKQTAASISGQLAGLLADHKTIRIQIIQDKVEAQ